MPKISVIIPIYNVEKYLVECLDSVIHQTLKDIEIILVDDGSKDKCPDIIDKYASGDDRIKAIHKSNGGYGSAMNVGLSNASGEYIAIVEPDDFIDHKMFEDLYASAVENNADIVKSGYIENFDIGENSYQKQKPDNKGFVAPKGVFKLSQYPIFMLMHPSIWSCIYKKEFLDKHNIRFVEAPGAGWTDNPFQVQTMCLADRITYVDKAYYYWRNVNIDESMSLKDYTIPFKRNAEILSWLKEQNITDIGILSNLIKRQSAYFHIINRIIKKEDIPNYLKLLKEYTNYLDYSMVNSSKIIKPREKRFLNLLKSAPKFAIFGDKFKVLKDNTLKFRFNKKEKYVLLFGKYVWRGK